VRADHARHRPLHGGVRGLLVLAGVLVLLAGIQLFVFPLRTDEWFAWTINPPLTSVFLGAAYWSSAAVEWSASTRRTWAEARVAVPGVFAFTTLTLVVTLVHLDRFHLGPEHASATRVVTWAWIAIYVAVPVLMAVLWWRQSRMPHPDRPRRRPLPAAMRWTLALQATVLIPLGLLLLAVPAQMATAWPWEITPLTGRAIGAWLFSLGIVAAHSWVEHDVDRVLPAAVGSLAFVVLQAVALLRHGSDLRGGPATVAYLALLASFAVTGTVTLRRRERRIRV
jgi:hypothetical protein